MPPPADDAEDLHPLSAGPRSLLELAIDRWRDREAHQALARDAIELVFEPSACSVRPGDYRDALQAVDLDPTASDALKARLATDDRRDPLDALADAEFLHAAQLARVAELEARASRTQRADRIERDGVESLAVLLTLAESDRAQALPAAAVLLSLHDGERYPLDPARLRSLDAEGFGHALRLLRLHARVGRRAIARYLDDGDTDGDAALEALAVRFGRADPGD